MNPVISLEAVSKRYGDDIAVNELSLSIGDGELCVLVGPSGCGKTTTLRMVNRLIEPTRGRILLDGRRHHWRWIPIELRRGIGYVIQQGGLFPHRGWPTTSPPSPGCSAGTSSRIASPGRRAARARRPRPARYARRFPHELSGGERQRVGVARALGGRSAGAAHGRAVRRGRSHHPRSAPGGVPRASRRGWQDGRLRHPRHRRGGHAWATASPCSSGGVLEQYDTPAEVLGRPATAFVADFVGADRGVKRLAVVGVR